MVNVQAETQMEWTQQISGCDGDPSSAVRANEFQEKGLSQNTDRKSIFFFVLRMDFMACILHCVGCLRVCLWTTNYTRSSAAGIAISIAIVIRRDVSSFCSIFIATRFSAARIAKSVQCVVFSREPHFAETIGLRVWVRAESKPKAHEKFSLWHCESWESSHQQTNRIQKSFETKIMTKVWGREGERERDWEQKSVNK